ncbi:MAG: CBS domain-containing protein [Anaerolineaceae bacterium]|nr:CBS domain-containing protein [Anaerolineaceae bacterium]
MPDLSLQKKANRLRIYISESDRWRGKPLDSAILDTLRAQGMAGATVIRGVAGFGAHSQIHNAGIEVLSMELPVVLEVIDTPEKIDSILEIVYPMVREGLITLEDVQIVKYTHRFLNPLPADRLVSEVMTLEVISLSPAMTVQQAWKKMLETTLKALPVIDPDGKVIGILTDEDLLERAGIRQRLSIAIRMDDAEIDQELHAMEKSTLTVGDVMTHPVVTVNDVDTLGAATTQMVRSGLKRLPVVNADGVLVGVLSRLDILRQVAQTHSIPLASHFSSDVAKTVKDVMSTNIPMVNQEEDLATIIEKFTQTNSHRLIVVDLEGKVIGLISDSDVVARVQPSSRRGILDAFRRIGKPPAGKEIAKDIMSSGPLVVSPELSVVEATQKMLAESRKWLVVVDNENHPLGLVDRQILLEAVVSLHGNRK